MNAELREGSGSGMKDTSADVRLVRATLAMGWRTEGVGAGCRRGQSSSAL